MTFTMVDLMMMAIAAALVVAAVAVWRLTNRLTATAASVEQAVDQIVNLTPKISALADNANAELEELRGLTRRSKSVAADVQTITNEVAHGVALLGLAKRSQALAAGAKAGLDVLRQSQSKNHSPSRNGG